MPYLPYLPIYHRPPNKFLRYELRKFEVETCIRAITGTERIAIFLDKNGNNKKCQRKLCGIIFKKNYDVY